MPSVSDAPIRLQGKAIEHIFESSTEIIDSIKNYYVNETLKQIYKIIGSLDFVGNPTMVLNSFVTGVRDFFVAPSQEFLRTPNNPSRVGIGVAKGTLSLLSHSASGVFGFAAKMAASAGQAAASLSFDANYQIWHRDMIVAEAKSLDRHYKKRGLQSVQDMVTRPILDIIRGAALGVSGLIVSPYRGAQRKGRSGFAKGVALGLVGVITKPTVGVLDALTHFVGSIHDLAKSVNLLEKRYQPARKIRLPSFFGLQDMLLPFDMITARSVTLLRLYPMKAKRIARRKRESLTETHVVSEILNLEPGVTTFVIVSTQRVLLCKVKKEPSGTLVPNLCWELYLFTDSIITPKVQERGHNGVALVITTKKVSYDVVIDSLPSTPMDSGIGHTPVTPNRNIGVIDNSSHSFLLAANSDKLVDTSSSQGHTPPRQHMQRLHSLKSGRTLFSRSMASGRSNFSRSSATDLSLLGTQPSHRILFGEEIDVAEAAPLQEGQLPVENHFHGTSKSQRGDFTEWYTILADFQHRRQLSRVHNAIRCVTRNLDAIILDRGLGPDGSTEGYTTFGDMIFTKEDARARKMDFLDDENETVRNLEKAPWVHECMFEDYRFIGAKETATKFKEERHTWTLQHELHLSATRGGPRWLMKARADAMFVPDEKPPLPNTPVAKSAAARDILDQLEKGVLSHNDAKQRIAALNDSVMFEDSSSSWEESAGPTGSLDQFDVESTSRTNDDLFASARQVESIRSITSLRFVSSTQLSCGKNILSLPTNRKNKMYRDEKPLNAEALNNTSPKSADAETNSLHDRAEEGVDNRSRMLSADTSDGYHSANGEREHEEVHPKAAGEALDRLNKVERMLEQLVAITLHQAKQRQDPAPTMASGTSETSVLLKELEQLRQELHAKKEQEASMESMQAEIQFLRSAITSQNPGSFSPMVSPALSFDRAILERPFRVGAEKVMVLGRVLKRSAKFAGNRVSSRLNSRGEQLGPDGSRFSASSSLSDDASAMSMPTYSLIPNAGSRSAASNLSIANAPTPSSMPHTKRVERMERLSGLIDEDPYLRAELASDDELTSDQKPSSKVRSKLDMSQSL